ncbi:Cysteinyl-tRNA synthetase [Hordeum vulgare]|nr:Cysteinyl-tRNA synthetase [Hordeum vulgare]
MCSRECLFHIEEQIRTRRNARIGVGLHLDLEEHPEEEELPAAPGYNMDEAKPEFVVAQSAKMTEQQAILKSIQDEDYVKVDRQFIWHE